MFKDTQTLRNELTEYASPHSRITRMVQSGRWIRVRRGLYVDSEGPALNPLILAGILYGPSYISFEYALSLHSLIPEKVHVITCASFRKNKKKIHDTPVGRFTYACIPEKAYPLGVTIQEEDGGLNYLIATPEKALCDQLYKLGNIPSRRALQDALFENLRLEKEDILNMDTPVLLELAPLYGRAGLRFFAEWLKGEVRHA